MNSTTLSEKPSTPAAGSDIAAIGAVPGRIVSAWARQDPVAFAEVFTEDGSMILPGVFRKGRREIAEFMTQAFAGPYRDTRVTGTPFDVRVISPDVALVLTEGGVIPAGADDVPPQARIRGSWLVVRQEGEWKLAAYQNTVKD